ncbi:hypothetical protein HJC23_000879 [Cyclotella cryptica]|uniref:SEA domain-containing protein n=1 Tax=Cyclotella cryptica TaxID=29204 RepID=A0ABD3PTE8_9STRA|eukprot:CCRYP_011600-RA/>CCRYP_011600-RA protein AED:0.35 eAED:0.35 QI:191/1/1/1/0/0/2/290/366
MVAAFCTVFILVLATLFECGHSQSATAFPGSQIDAANTSLIVTSEPSPRPSGVDLNEMDFGGSNVTFKDNATQPSTPTEVEVTSTSISINVSSTPSLRPSAAGLDKAGDEATNITASDEASPHSNLSFASPIVQVTPTPVPTVSGSWSSSTDDLLAILSGSSPGSSLTVEAVVFFTFPDNSTWNESRVDEVSTAVQEFLGSQANFSGVPVTVGVTPGDVYGVLSPDGTNGERTVAVTLTITVPWIEMGLIDEYTLQLLLEQSISESKSALVESLSNAFDYDFDANGVKVSFIVLLTPPTSTPTYAPTTAAAFNEIKRKRRIRSWIFISIFWVIVLMCFALENGLCAYKSWHANRDQYGTVNAGHLD